MPSISAPIATRNRAVSCTCGSEAALRSVVSPVAMTAAISAFSVAGDARLVKKNVGADEALAP